MFRTTENNISWKRIFFDALLVVSCIPMLYTYVGAIYETLDNELFHGISGVISGVWFMGLYFLVSGILPVCLIYNVGFLIIGKRQNVLKKYEIIIAVINLVLMVIACVLSVLAVFSMF